MDTQHGKPLLSATNHHVDSCGEPPHVQSEDGVYLGYFENRHREQAVFRLDHRTGQATLQLGDAGWETTYPVKDGLVDGLILNAEEMVWLHTCWQAATGQPVKAPGLELVDNLFRLLHDLKEGHPAVVENIYERLEAVFGAGKTTPKRKVK